jgi:hypothetical protein
VDVVQVLNVGVDGDALGPAHARLHQPVNRVVAAASHTYDYNLALAWSTKPLAVYFVACPAQRLLHENHFSNASRIHAEALSPRVSDCLI